jgi:hypothetical protein
MSEGQPYLGPSHSPKAICRWCGTQTSGSWIESRNEYGVSVYFCSEDCRIAYSAQDERTAGLCLAFFGVVILIWAAVLALSDPLALFPLPNESFPQISTVIDGLVLLGILCFSTSYVLVLKSRRGLEIRKRVPRDSKLDRKGLAFEVKRGEFRSVTCAICGAPLKFRGSTEEMRRAPNRVYTCEFCGAQGYIEWPTDE